MRTPSEDIYVQMLEGGLTALGDASYPASGSYIDVSNYPVFEFLIGLDVVVTPDFQVQQADADDGALKDVDGAGITTVATGDDGKWLRIVVESARLDIANDYHFVTLTVANTTTDNANIWFIGHNGRHLPVTLHANELTPVVVAG